MGGEEELLFILNLGTRWGWVVSFTLRPRFTSGERTPGTHCAGGWMGPRTGLDAEARGKILCLCQGSNPDRPARSQTLYCLSYRGSCNSTTPQYQGGRTDSIIGPCERNDRYRHYRTVWKRHEERMWMSTIEMNGCGLKDRRGYRVGDTTGLENLRFRPSIFLTNFRYD
jgi:hypothetical protein